MRANHLGVLRRSTRSYELGPGVSGSAGLKISLSVLLLIVVSFGAGLYSGEYVPGPGLSFGLSSRRDDILCERVDSVGRSPMYSPVFSAGMQHIVSDRLPTLNLR